MYLFLFILGSTAYFLAFMNVLVIGSGGREHALAWKLAQSPRVTKMWCAPGNGGMAGEKLSSNNSAVECVPIAADRLRELLDFASRERVDMTVVGPDNPLALGIVDKFKAAGLPIWGPGKRAAQFESSKAFSQDFMEKYGIPTAKAGTFSSVEKAKKFAEELGGRCAVKADGLALGKGVIICRTEEEAEGAIEEMLLKQTFGEAGKKIIIQELLEGMEISLHAFCDGRTARLFPSAQDHKRALDGDEGLNTGGMGAYSPTPFLSDAELEAAGQSILEKWLKGCREEGIDFKGILYPGVMLTSEGPKVLEFNARFGDPETQVYLPRLENDLLDVVEACVEEKLDRLELRWKKEAVVCVVMASGGYPGEYARGKEVHGLEEAGAQPGVKIFHAGTAIQEGRVVTTGGRVLGVTATGENLARARSLAYDAVNKIHFEGAHFRRDIGSKALARG